ncbi:MAG: hypothetical protein ACI83D_000472 [Planctomycetota bacterium]|jgi:hypothetical protein
MLSHEDTIAATWTTPEFVYTENTPDWFWGIGLVTLAGAVLSFVFGNTLFGILILIGGVLLMAFSRHKPKDVEVSLSKVGVSINTDFASYETINTFWIHVDKHEHYKVFLQFDPEGEVKMVAPIAEDIDPGQVREFLLNYIKEEELQESFPLRILEKFGY